MQQLRELLTHERAARPLFAAHLQSSLGTGAAYVALLVIAYERFHSPLAVSSILLCEFLPALLFGAVLGAAADRWSRKTMLVCADVLRAAAFIGLALADSFAATVALAALAGVGQAAFGPAVMASIPSLVSERRLGAATGVYGAIQEFGYTAGPILGAGAFALIGATGVLFVNGITFAISAALLATLTIARVAQEPGVRKPPLLTSARDGARALRRNRAAWTVVLSSTFFVCFFGAMNVAEVILVNTTLDGGAVAYAITTAAMGLGVTAGALLAARGDSPELGRRLYLAGIATVGVGMAACALAPVLAVAVVAFLVIGIGNGVALTSENVLLQQLIPDEIKGRVFGLKGAMISGAFLVSYFGGGLLVAAVGTRATFGVIAVGSLVVCLTARVVLATDRRSALAPAPA